MARKLKAGRDDGRPPFGACGPKEGVLEACWGESSRRGERCGEATFRSVCLNSAVWSSFDLPPAFDGLSSEVVTGDTWL